MAAVGIAEAARMAGVAQSTLHRAMRAGRLAFIKDEAGLRRIDVAELERVFGTLSPRTTNLPVGNGALPRSEVRTEARKITHSGEIDALHALLDERERTIARQDEAIRDLRTRLDLEATERRAEAEGRREAERKLTALLTHRQAGSVPAVQKAEVPWWRRWRR
jgi:hypothetical protein